MLGVAEVKKLGTTFSKGESMSSAPVAQKSNGQAVAALVLGIVSVVFVWFWIISIPAAIIAIILGHLSFKKATQSGGQGKGMPMTGFILGYAGLAGTIFWLIVAAILLAMSAGLSTY